MCFKKLRIINFIIIIIIVISTYIISISLLSLLSFFHYHYHHCLPFIDAVPMKKSVVSAKSNLSLPDPLKKNREGIAKAAGGRSRLRIFLIHGEDQCIIYIYIYNLYTVYTYIPYIYILNISLIFFDLPHWSPLNVNIVKAAGVLIFRRRIVRTVERHGAPGGSGHNIYYQYDS